MPTTTATTSVPTPSSPIFGPPMFGAGRIPLYENQSYIPVTPTHRGTFSTTAGLTPLVQPPFGSGLDGTDPMSLYLEVAREKAKRDLLESFRRPPSEIPTQNPRTYGPPIGAMNREPADPTSGIWAPTEGRSRKSPTPKRARSGQDKGKEPEKSSSSSSSSGSDSSDIPWTEPSGSSSPSSPSRSSSSSSLSDRTSSSSSSSEDNRRRRRRRRPAQGDELTEMLKLYLAAQLQAQGQRRGRTDAKVDKDLGIPKFTAEMGRKTGFRTWWADMLTALRARGIVDPDSVVRHLLSSRYTEAEVWKGWQNKLPSRERFHLDTLLGRLDRFYPVIEIGTESHKEAFRRHTQAGATLADYLRRKHELWHAAWPPDPLQEGYVQPELVEEFRTWFINGLDADLKLKVNEYIADCRYNGEVATWNRVYQLAESREWAKRQCAEKSPDDKRVCKFFLAGNCTDKKCKFLHQNRSGKGSGANGGKKKVAGKGSGKGGNSGSSGNSGGAAAGDADALKKRQDNVTQKCRCGHAPEHPKWTCRHANVDCQVCKKRGHFAYSCPDATCKKCSKKGHTATVCGLDPKNFH